jgi:hypothetical protein
MSEQAKAAEKVAVGSQAADKPAQNQQQTKRPNAQAVSDPREVATVIMARMNMVNAKKDELTIAIKGLSDITQQLANAYAEQVQMIKRLGNRVKALEVTAGANGAHPPAAAQGRDREVA